MKQQIEEVVQIALDELTADPDNRKVGGFNPAKLEQLAESIKAVGVQQPAVVRRIEIDEDKFEIIAGERRWRAAKIAGLTTLPCVIRNLDDVTVLKIRTIENLQREDVHPLDEADGYARLLKRAGYDAEHLAQEVGRSASYVYQRLKLLDLIPAARKMLIEGKITAGHAILIARLQPDQQEEVLENFNRRFGGNGPSVRELDEYIREHILMDLGKTSFQKNDAYLVTAAGACTTCQKRTGFQPALFADVCKCKRDYCLDPKCFAAKMDALVKQRQEELAADETHLLVAENWLSYNEEKKLPKGTITKNDWEECKAKDVGAVRCLVVDGIGRGRITWGKKNEHHRYEPSPQVKAADQRKKRELESKRAARRLVWDKVFQKLQLPTQQSDLPLELLRIIALQFWEELVNDTRVFLAKIEGWEQPKKKAGDFGNGRDEQGKAFIAQRDRTGLLVFLVKMALVRGLDVQEYYNDNPKGLHGAAQALGLDPKAIEARAKKELLAKAKEKPKAKPKSKPMPKKKS